jgi:hypothetical protein
MNQRRERGESDDPSGGRLPRFEAQPKFETLVMRGPRRFALTTRLSSGECVDVPLGRVSLEMLWEPPRP